jgi:hypothetical protein
MFKVRIKTSPGETNPKSTGQQEDYGLVRNLRGMQNSPEQFAVNDTMGAVPRDQANIEVEGGESVIGDINNDGTMELMHFKGKRHTEGGVPVNIPEGSFIYSDTKNLTIKDPEVIEKIFNLPFRKQGYTPAEISKKYDINMYVEILKDETSDPLAKRSAAEMLKKNKQKLGLLAFIQESMKGFPDGIPAIAEEVLSSMGIDPNQMAQEFAPQQPQQGQMMPPPQEGPGIPMSEDEDAMQGMMPEGPAVAPEDLANQMSAKFGGVMLPSYEQAGAVSGCPTGYVWNAKASACVLPQYKSSEVYRIPAEGFASNAPKWERQSAPVISTPKKKPTVSDVKAQKLFDESFRVLTPAEIQAQKKAKIKAETFDARALLENAANQRIKIITPPSEKVEPIPGSMASQFKGDPYKKYYDPETGKEIKPLVYSEDASGLTAEEKAKRTKDQRENPYKYNIPGFGSTSDLKDYMSENYQQQVAGDVFYKALLTNDPGEMMRAAEEIKNIDVPWSVGWLPWTDQDKIDDMYTILHEEALKKINEKQKDIIVKDYSVSTVKTKLNDVIAKYEKLRDDATDIQTKLAYAAKLDKFNKYKKRLITDNLYSYFVDGVKESNVKSNSSWFDYDLGDPIQDQYMGYPGMGDESTMMSVVEEITKEHDKINKTNVAIESPLAFKGQTSAGGSGRGDVLSFGSPSASFEIMSTESRVRDVYNSLYGKSTPKDAKGYAKEYKLNAAPTSTFTMGKNDDGQMVWFELTENKSDLLVTNPEWVKTLNAAATIKEGKTVMLAPAKEPVDIIQMLEEENKLNPPVTPEKVKPKMDVVAPISKPKQKYEAEGVSDQTFDELFGKGGMKYGGTMPSLGSDIAIGDKMFRYGGLINENGKLRYDRGGSVLPKYNNAGTVTGKGEPVKGAETVSTKPNVNGGKPIVSYTLTYNHSDGKPEHATVVNVIADQATGNVIARQNTVTNESIPNDAQITRSSHEYITKDNLNDYEKKILADKWNGAKGEAEYLTYLNSAQEMRRNPEFRKDLYGQYKKDIQQQNNYTGRATGKSTYNPKLATMTETEMMDQLLSFEERNARLSSFGLVNGEQNVQGGSDQGKYINKTANELIKANPTALGDLDFSQGYKGQAGYIAYNNLLTKDPKYTAQNFASPQYGVSDEDIGYGKSTVSGIDNFNTNTTLKQRLGWNSTPPPPVEIPGSKNAFYCVEYTDGSKEIKTVSYKDTEQPVAPSGQVGDKTVKLATQYGTSDEATKNCIPDPKIPPGKIPPPVQSPTWFAPDIVNYAAATRQIIPNTPPTLRQMAQPISGYDTINPITRIAGTTGLMRQQQDLAMNTMDATTGFAAMAGQGYDQLSKDIAGVEEYNATNIVNPYLTRIGNLATDVDYKNTMLRGKFDQEGAVYQEELAGQRNKKAAQEAMLFGQGFGNVLKDNTLRLAYPNAWHAQRLTPDLAWSGVGRDPLAASTNVSPGGGAGVGAAQEDCSTVYATAYESVKGQTTMDEAAKKEYAANMQKACISRNLNSANQQNKTQQQQYATGLSSQVLGSSRFGGAMYTAPGAMEYGGMYFDDNY